MSEAIKLLIKKGADVNVVHKYTGSYGEIFVRTPLQAAVENSWDPTREIVHTLFDHGASVILASLNQPDESGALQTVCRTHDIDLVKAFLEHIMTDEVQKFDAKSV